METALFAPEARSAATLAQKVRQNGWRALLLDAGFRTSVERAAYAHLLAATGQPLEAAPFTRLYAGHESCEHLTPTPTAAARLLTAAERLRLALTIVLPPTYASREGQVRRLLEALARSQAPGLEIVCAEWGTVALVHEHPPLQPVMGRIMGRMKRFERWSRAAPRPNVSSLPGLSPDEVLQNQQRVHRLPSWSLPDERALAESLGVSRVELDPVPQGLDPSVAEWKALSLHVPWSYVTLGRHCHLRATVEGVDQVDHDAPCKVWCRKKVLVDDHAQPMAPLVHAGNAVYMENVESLAKVPPDVRTIARWVVSPQP